MDSTVLASRTHALLALVCASVPLLACNDDTAANDEDSSSTGQAEESSGTSPPTTSLSGADSSSSGSADTTASTADTSDSGTGTDEGTTTIGTSETGSSSSESSSSSDASSSEDSGNAPLECPAADLDPMVADQVFGNTIGVEDDFSGSCGGAGAPDVGFTFTAPADGLYTFDTLGSQLDTVLYLLDGVCTGSEIACNDDGAGSQSALTVQLAADQTVTAVVDGNSGAGAPFQIRVRPGSYTCPAGDIGAVAPAVVSGDNSDAFDASSSTCNGGAGPEDGWLFTAPTTGTFSLDTFGSSFPSVLYVLDGTCAGPEIACGEEGVLVDLVAGQEVTVVVDSHFEQGAYDLHVGTLGGACPDDDLGSSLPQSIAGDTTAGDNTSSSSCGGDFSPDDLYEFTAPHAGLYTFDTIGSTLDTVLYMRNGCGGAELDCNDDFSAGDTDSRLLAGLANGQTVLLGVDGNGSGAYTLNLAEVPCPDEDLGNTVPQVVMGTNAGGFDKLQGSCSSGNPNDESADVAYSFTAPADGEYVFDTAGSSFNTVLYALDGAACNAPEIACSDDFAFQQTSAMSVPMLAGETITVVVDGNFNASGNYQLNVGVLGGGACPDVDLGGTVPSATAGDTSTGDNTVAGTCGGFTQPDDTYLFTAEEAGLYIFDTFGSAYDTVLILREGGCDGAEIDCNDDFNFLQQSRVDADLEVGETVMIGVDGNFASGSYTLNVQYVTCPDIDIEMTFPEMLDGSTVGLADKLAVTSGLCFDGAAPDYAIEWTAPADGTYNFDLSGSDYDTVIFLQDLACGGAELTCNDDGPFGLQSLATIDLLQDQTIIIVVSGFNSESGNFSLSIN
jgi:hypothetical protein